ncbi:MAG: glycoside hydrolase family 97 catalytic domain-containing protein [Verrucomicrobia bacterium]|nr:glycoside hydrolase family 97 catalytic domain-containing protein [Verrucomicrobiota bacterium]
MLPHDDIPPQSWTGPGTFHTTHWSVVLATREGGDVRAARALETLCRAYWYPLYAYLRREGWSEPDAQDLPQGFFAHLFEHHTLDRAAREKGRFRSFLLASLKYYIASQRARDQRQKRGGGQTLLSLDAMSGQERYHSEPRDERTPDQLFERRWAMKLLDRTLARLAREYGEGDRTGLFAALQPFLAVKGGGESCAALAARFGRSEETITKPVQRMRRRYQELFRNCRKAGVKGVKIDFFNSESKTIIDAYEDLARRAAKYQLMINFHGANKPTGEARTWPNEITREGIREQEYVLWGSLPLTHYGALPFTRMAAGHADFLPGYVQPRFLKNTTTIFQMACVLVFSSPFLCWPDNPEAYLNSPLLQFVRTVPVTWDETRILPGSAIGDTVIMARRKKAEWYVAVLNCRSEARTLELDLSALNLAGKELTLYRDGPTSASCQIESGVKPPSDGRLSIALQPGGGFIAHARSPQTFPGWK